MPDLRPALRFADDLARVEADYIAAVGQAMGITRLILVEAVAKGGVNNTGLSAVIRRELDDLRRQTRQTATELSQPVLEVASTLAKEQIEAIQRAITPPQGQGGGPPAIDFDLLKGMTAAEQQQILSGMVSNLTGWIDQLQAQLQVELNRLRAAGEATDTVIERLLDEELTAGRVSTWRQGTNTMQNQGQRDIWSAGTATTGMYYQAGQSISGQRWKHQAIAAIDERTTDCCLRVHGQIKDLNDPFELRGTPRFADRIQHPPFHFYCRTAEGLYVEEFEAFGITTETMRSAAQAEIEARESTGTRVEIHPASATSRR